MIYPKISIITPSYNQAEYLEHTIQSVLSQGYPNLEYIIIDGGSTDGSVDIIKKYESQLAYWVSERDNGMYEAIQKGFDKSTGEIMAWINSDDMYHPKSLFVVAELFSNNTKVKWIQGYPNVINEKGELVFTREPRYLREAFLLRRYRDWNFIQQESTFWKRELWERAGNKISTNYKYCGDFELWIRFFQFEKMYISTKMLGSFRIRPGQISQVNHDKYLEECNMVIKLHIESLSFYTKSKIKILKFIEPTVKKLNFIYKRIAFYSESCSEQILIR